MPLKKSENTILLTKTKSTKRNRKMSAQQILQAALNVFSEVGYDAATTKMIAQRAGLNESLIQRYFQSKANLLVEVTHACFEALKNEAPYLAQNNPEEEIYQFLINKLHHDTKNQDFLRILISRLLLDENIRRDLHSRKKSKPDLFFHKRLANFKKKGLIKDNIVIKELVASIMAQSMSVGFMERILFNKSIESCKKQFRIFVKNITQGISV